MKNLQQDADKSDHHDEHPTHLDNHTQLLRVGTLLEAVKSGIDPLFETPEFRATCCRSPEMLASVRSIARSRTVAVIASSSASDSALAAVFACSMVKPPASRRSASRRVSNAIVTM